MFPVAHGANYREHERRGIVDAPVLRRRRLLQSSLPLPAPHERWTARLPEAGLSRELAQVPAAAGLLAAAALIGLGVPAPAVAKEPSRYVPQHRIYTTPWPSSPIITPRYLYFPGDKPDPNAMPAPGTCAPTGESCTVEELCQVWGEC